MNITRDGNMDLSDAKFVTDDSDRRVQSGDVLFNNTNSPALVGKTAFVGLAGDFAYSNHMTRLRPPPQMLDGRFLARQVHWRWSSGYFESICSNHVNQASVSSKRLSRVVVGAPAVSEQRRIVDLLEEHLSSLDAAESTLRACLTRVDRLDQAMLEQAFRGNLVSDDLSEGTAQELLGSMDIHRPHVASISEAAWVFARMGDLFEINVGATPARRSPELWDGDLPWVSSGEVAFNRIDSTRESIRRIAAGNPATRIHPPGTVLLAMIGEGKTRGQAAILNIEAAHNQNCASIRVSKTPMLPEYVYFFLRRRYAETRRSASGGNQPALNKARVEAIVMPVAPLATQRRLVAVLIEHEFQSDRLRGELTRSVQRGAALRRALFAAAFSGRLTGRSSDSELVEELADQEAS